MSRCAPTPFRGFFLFATFIDSSGTSVFFEQSSSPVIPVRTLTFQTSACEKVTTNPADESPYEKLPENPSEERHELMLTIFPIRLRMTGKSKNVPESEIERSSPSDRSGQSTIYGTGDDPINRELRHQLSKWGRCVPSEIEVTMRKHSIRKGKTYLL